NEFLKRRSLEDDVAFFIRDQARSIEHDPVVAADKIDENDRQLLEFRSMCDHIAPKADLALVVRRCVDRDKHLSAELDDLVRRVGLVKAIFPEGLVVPKVFADDNAYLLSSDIKEAMR